jgi:hypothetical protein
MFEPKPSAIRPPGTVVPWSERAKDLPEIKGDTEIVRQVWEGTDSLAYTFIWQVLLSF